MLELLVERRGLGNLVELAVDLHALEAALQKLGEVLAVFALAAAHHGRQQIKPRAFLQRQHPVDHLRDGLALDRETRGRRIGDADARPQQPHVVVDLGDGADRRARVARGGLLLDRDRRRQPVDAVDVRLLHHLEELPRIGRERLDVAPLALGIDRVERERRLARARQARDHHQPVARDVDVDVLQIVLARPVDRDHAGVGVAAVVLAARGHRGRFVAVRAKGNPQRSQRRAAAPATGPESPAAIHRHWKTRESPLRRGQGAYRTYQEQDRKPAADGLYLEGENRPHRAPNRAHRNRVRIGCDSRMNTEAENPHRRLRWPEA